MVEKTSVRKKLESVDRAWEPRLLAELNGQHVRLAKLEGEFIWHRHENEDEMFLVLYGQLRILLRDGEVTLGPDDLVVIPRGIEHKPVAVEPTAVLLFEPAETINTGDVTDDRTVTTVEPI